MGYVMLLPIICFIVLGIFFSFSKGEFLVSGYKTMPKREKKKYDTVAMSRFMAKIMFALSFSTLLCFLSFFLDIWYLLIVGIVLFVAVIAFMLIYMNKSNKFKK